MVGPRLDIPHRGYCILLHPAYTKNCQPCGLAASGGPLSGYPPGAFLFVLRDGNVSLVQRIVGALIRGGDYARGFKYM